MRCSRPPIPPVPPSATKSINISRKLGLVGQAKTTLYFRQWRQIPAKVGDAHTAVYAHCVLPMYIGSYLEPHSLSVHRFVSTHLPGNTKMRVDLRYSYFQPAARVSLYRRRRGGIVTMNHEYDMVPSQPGRLSKIEGAVQCMYVCSTCQHSIILFWALILAVCSPPFPPSKRAPLSPKQDRRVLQSTACCARNQMITTLVRAGFRAAQIPIYAYLMLCT